MEPGSGLSIKTVKLHAMFSVARVKVYTQPTGIVIIAALIYFSINLPIMLKIQL